MFFEGVEPEEAEEEEWSGSGGGFEKIIIPKGEEGPIVEEMLTKGRREFVDPEDFADAESFDGEVPFEQDLEPTTKLIKQYMDAGVGDL